MLLYPSNLARNSGGGVKRSPSRLFRTSSLERGATVLEVLGGEPILAVDSGQVGRRACPVSSCSPGLTSISRPGPAGADLPASYFLTNCSICSRVIPVSFSRSGVTASLASRSLTVRSTISVWSWPLGAMSSPVGVLGIDGAGGGFALVLGVLSGGPRSRRRPAADRRPSGTAGLLALAGLARGLAATGLRAALAAGGLAGLGLAAASLPDVSPFPCPSEPSPFSPGFRRACDPDSASRLALARRVALLSLTLALGLGTRALAGRFALVLRRARLGSRGVGGLICRRAARSPLLVRERPGRSRP